MSIIKGLKNISSITLLQAIDSSVNVYIVLLFKYMKKDNRSITRA